MKAYGVNELRRMFLEFFESKGHLALKSFSLEMCIRDRNEEARTGQPDLVWWQKEGGKISGHMRSKFKTGQ